MYEKKHNNHQTLIKYILISLLILAISLLTGAVVNLILSSAGITDDSMSHIIGMLEGIIGAVATGLVLFQLKCAEKTEIHENDINEATFLLNLNQTFIQDPNMVEVERLLENQTYYETEHVEIIHTDNRHIFINYLVYLEGLAPLVINGVLSLEYIDNLMAYRFFLATENRELQEKELCKFANYYRGCFQLYKIWKQYRVDHSLPTPSDECEEENITRSLWDYEDFEKYLA